MARILIEGGYVIPVVRDEVIADGVVAFDGARITYAGPCHGFDRDSFAADRVVNARGKAVLPGLVNTHTHLVGAYIKALTEDVPGKANAAGLYKRAFPVVSLIEEGDVYCGCMTHGLEMLMTGTTTISNTWSNEKLAGPVVRDLGIRAVLSEMIFETELTALSPSNMDRPWRPDMAKRGLEAAVELYETWHGKEDGRITTRISPGGPGYCSADAIEKCRELAAKQGVGINIHIAEVPGETEFVTARYGKRPIELGRDLGVLGPGTIAFHCVFLSDSDIDILAETGTKLSHTSFHVPKRGYFPPMEKVYAKGIDVSFGSDWCSNDLWKFMRAGILIPRAKTGDVGMLSGYDALRMATLGGARALGIESDIGSLEVGKKADVILVDVTTPWCNPIRTENLITNLVFNANGSDVTDVFVDGRPVVENREVRTVDRSAVLREAQRCADRIWRQASRTW
ncbi:MAG TPA: amidohydrolase family protein [Alphaproteobacteria bacterium]|nr:amidohydrolase family protein [Alphaproteobacteria bacterium]